MLPFPIFVLLLFSVTLLAPTPSLLIDFIMNPTLQASVWNTLPAPIKSSSFVPPEAAPLLPALFSATTLDAVPTRCGPNPIHVAPNKTTLHSLVDNRITCAAVLFVVSLAMFNCLIYKLLVKNSNGKHDAEGSSELSMSSPCLTLTASPSQESVHDQKVNMMTPLLLSIDTSKSIFGSFEPEGLPRAATAPPFSSFEVAVSSESSTLLKQPVPFLQVLTREFSIDDSEKARETDGDSSPVSPLASDSTWVDPPSDIVARSTDPATLSTSPVFSAIEIDDFELELPQHTLDAEAAKDDSAALSLPDASNMSHHQEEQEPGSESHVDGISSPIVEDASESDTNEVFHYQPSRSESRDEETFNYQRMDWTEETQESPPALATEDQAPSPHFSAHLNDQHLGPVPSLSVETPIPEVVDTCSVSPRSLLLSDVTPRQAVVYAEDDIHVGLKNRGQGKSAFVNRCSSADDLGSKFKLTKAVHALITNDGHIDRTAIHARDITDDDTTTHSQVTILRADAPIFEPRSSGRDKVALLPELSSVGLTASIHARRGGISQMEGCVGVSESMHATRRACAPATTSEIARDSPEPSSEDYGFQASAPVAKKPRSPEDTATGMSILPGITSGIHASIHAPRPLSTTAPEAHDDAIMIGTDTLEQQTTPTGMPSNSSPTDKSTRSGLSASIHACSSSWDVQPIGTHTSDTPNWAAASAAAREQDSSTSPGSSVPAKRNDSPGAALDDDTPELQLPTTTRCAANDQQQQDGSVDSSDRSSDHAEDDQDSTTSTGMTDDGLDEADDRATSEQLEGFESAVQSPQTRGSRGKRSRRSRQKYVPPPRMRDPHMPPFDILPTQMRAPASTPNAAAAARPGQYYHHGHTPPPPPLHRPNSAPYPMVPPNSFMPNRLEQHPPYHHPQYIASPHRPEQYTPYYQPQHTGSPSHMVVPYPPPVPGFRLPGPSYPTGYFPGPHPQQISPQAPLHGR